MIEINSGFNKSHLIIAASEFVNNRLLNKLHIGTYPTTKILNLSNKPIIKKIKQLRKLENRSELYLTDNYIKQYIPQEAIHQFSYLLQYKVSKKNTLSKLIIKIGEILDIFSHYWFGNGIANYFNKKSNFDTKLYLYRAGFGHKSVAIAKKHGAITVCDHTIAHPKVIEFMVNNHGNYPDKNGNHEISHFWKMVEQDILQADYILVNSDFVKDTCIYEGLEPDKISVIYLGVDDKFFNYLPEKRSYSKNKETIRFLFVGFFDRRKGANEIINAFSKLTDTNWTLDIVGNVSKDIKDTNQKFLKLNNVKTHGFMLRDDIAKLMSRSDVFIFPSLVEGSARVVFEAMASGCYIITTKNSGSIVENGIHGTLISPGYSDELLAVVEKLIENRDGISEIGLYNAKIIKENYLQSQYGKKLLDFYMKTI